MKPWPLLLLSLFLRFLVIPIVVVLAVNAANRIVNISIADVNVAVIVLAVIVFNLIYSQFEADSRRIADLEERFDELRRKLTKTVS